MNVLFIHCPNRLSRKPEFFPYGLGILASILKNTGHTPYIYDANIHRDLYELDQFLLNNNKWDLVGLSGLVTTYGFQKKVAGFIKKKLPNATIISGGGLASAIPELLVEKTEVDIAVVGEGENTIVELVTSLGEKGDLYDVHGIVWNNKNEITKNKPAILIEDLDTIPFPDWEIAGLSNYFEYSGFTHKGLNASSFRKRADLLTTRGCPYTCTFCSNVYVRGKLRRRSIGNIIDEIKQLKDRYKIDSLDFLDENFCFSKQRVIEFCLKMINENIQLAWGTAARTDDVDKELLKLMKEAGCVFILYGFESGSQSILDKMNKKVSVEKAWSAFVETEKAGIEARGNLIIGHPGETIKSLNESLEFQRKRMTFLKKHRYNSSQLTFLKDEHLEKYFSTVSFCTPYPGSPLFTQYRDLVGDLEKFMLNITLTDAKKLFINLTSMSDMDLLAAQQVLSTPEYWGRNILIE